MQQLQQSLEEIRRKANDLVNFIGQNRERLDISAEVQERLLGARMP